MSEKTVYCLMVTGKDDHRLQYFVPRSIRNFIEQDYEHKHLLVINHHPTLSAFQPHMQIMTEIRTEKTTLGKMRNDAIRMYIPEDAYFCIWDDDDIRSTNYLSLLVYEKERGDYPIVQFQHRLNIDLLSQFRWGTSDTRGNATYLADKRFLTLCPYDEEKDTGEDLPLYQLPIDQKHIITDNDPKMYIRTCHGRNTSVYVHPYKTCIFPFAPDSEYTEWDVDEDQHDYISQFF